MTFSTDFRRSDRLPSWLRRKIPLLGECTHIERVVRRLNLHTICHEGLCPNRAECYSRGKVTFMILGDVCTRGCRFCSVKKGVAQKPDKGERDRIVRAVRELGLKHVIITSVTRDDLLDGGSSFYASVIAALKEIEPTPVVEALVPDFGGSTRALETVMRAGPDILSHNIETVRRLYGEIRLGADYDRSVLLLSDAKRIDKEVMTKSALILGLGETLDEVLEALWDLRSTGCDFVAIGQYLRPGIQQVPVSEFIPPERFSWLGKAAYQMGFTEVTSGPLVRSSYQENCLEPHRKRDTVTRADDARRSVL
jgi:lipoic acid synthetase